MIKRPTVKDKPMPIISSRNYHLVLVGGGHSHAIILKLWGMNPLANVRLTLITDVFYTPYSGMLPGHIAGFYSYDETHINLHHLALFAKADFYLDKVIGLDLTKNQVICQNSSPVAFDYLSIDIGSTPQMLTVKGASESVIPAKPVPQLLDAWSNIIQKAENCPTSPLSLAIVGGGAGGVELALNMQSCLSRILHPQKLTIYLIHKGEKVLQNHNNWVSYLLQNTLIKKRIKTYLQETVTEIRNNNEIFCQSGLKLQADHIFWVTQASAPSWVKASGLTTDKKGFILVKDTLQSVSHPPIFATGDIATMEHYQRPKAGVFAVRQGNPLFKNLQNILLEKPLKNYHPQKYYLALIGTGDKKAVASWGCFSVKSSLLWQWKDKIDRQFMQQFKDLSAIK